MKEFYSHGKLLLSGEYLVLDGALGLAGLDQLFAQGRRSRRRRAVRPLRRSSPPR